MLLCFNKVMLQQKSFLQTKTTVEASYWLQLNFKMIFTQKKELWNLSKISLGLGLTQLN